MVEKDPVCVTAHQLHSGLGMVISNATIADSLRRYASVLSLEGADRFKLKAYKNAAETIESLDSSVAQLVEDGRDLTELPGIGKGISQAITELVRTGKLSRFEKLSSALPSEQLELATRPRLDPKRVARIYKKLDIRSLAELEANLRSGKIREIFGPRMEFHIHRGLDDRPRHLLWNVEETTHRVEQFLGSLTGVRVSRAGSLRRKQDTVGDLNFLVTGKSAASVFHSFEHFESVIKTEQQTNAEQLFKLSSGVDVRLRWTKPDEWGAALTQATGSVNHVSQLFDLAKENCISFTAKGRSTPPDWLATEASVYAALGLDFIEPELREGGGEIEAAANGTLPSLVTFNDLRGDLHMHTVASDGSQSIEEMATAGREQGYEYIAITDHSQSLKIANGLTEQRLREQLDHIDELNGRMKGFRILKSAEVDILADGSLDYSDSVLKLLDLTVCSIHSRFALNKTQQTERILRAMDNPAFTILGHATGRLLLSREGYDIDIERVIRHAKRNNCFFEINSSPNRLDLSDEHAKLAKDAGVLIAINTDAHSTRELRFMHAGLQQARRGWLEAKDVLNTYPLSQLLKRVRR